MTKNSLENCTEFNKNSKEITTLTPSPVAIVCPLSGAYMIEASAGTGKTWTLTGIILRLLIEKQIKPEKMIAVTFTRMAAREMQERVHQRLIIFYQACLWLKENQEQLYKLNSESQLDTIEKNSKIIEALKDNVNQHLLLWLLKNKPNYLDITLNNIPLILSKLNKLFISTLDSLAQKFLKEYACFIGDNKKREIISQEKENIYIKNIVHNKMRQIHTQIYQNKSLYKIIDKCIFYNTEEMSNSISNALQFFSAKIDKPKNTIDGDLMELKRLISCIKQENYAIFSSYTQFDFCKQNNMNQSLTLVKKFNYLYEVIDCIKKHDIEAFKLLDENKIKWIQKLNQESLYSCFTKKATLVEKNRWFNLPLAKLMVICTAYNLYKKIKDNFIEYVRYKVACDVRYQLEKILKDNKETTYTLQTIKLVSALNGIRGKILAQRISNNYPVILIDEAQDLNGEQALLIEKIYLNHNIKPKQGFLLLVGDPKQAIYRFRGGDVANYNALKCMDINTQFTLGVNYRSNYLLINALNSWFDCGCGDMAKLGDNIFYQKIVAKKNTLELSWQQENKPIPKFLGRKPITFLHLSYENKDKDRIIALHVNSLLQSGQTIVENGVERLIIPSDIAILTRTQMEVYTIQSLLNDLTIDTIIQNDDNVFIGHASNDLYALFAAILDVNHSKISTLLSSLFAFSIEKTSEILSDDKHYSSIVIYLNQLKNLWLKEGVAYAMTQAFNSPPIINSTLWQYLAKFNKSEQYLADMWQLFEIVCTWQMPTSLFLAKFKQQQKQKNERYHRINIAKKSCVSIMTIHKSKGLEFNIVYIVDLQNGISKYDKKEKLYPYVENNKRKLSVTKGKQDNKNQDVSNGYFIQLDKKEIIDEKKRLGYVALTRASQQIFIITQDGKKTKSKSNTEIDNAMRAWKMINDNNQITIPERIKNDVDLINLDDLLNNNHLISIAYQEQNYTIDDLHAGHKQNNWHKQIQNTCFIEAKKTSFSALSKRFDKMKIINNNDFLNKNLDDSNDIRQQFMRGTQAGVFMHKILEKNNSELDQKQLIKETAKKLGLLFDDEVLTKLDIWVNSIISTPFLASGIPLNKLSKKHTEFSFMLALNNSFDPIKLAELLLTLGNKSIASIIQEKDQWLSYLNGEIDLLYQAGDKYYIVDYKSNFLESYDIDGMTAAMNEHGYWLQAAIYQVALHRLLKIKQADYCGNEQRYLGAIEYVFLRGIDDKNQTGRLLWQVPLALVFALDELFGLSNS